MTGEWYGGGKGQYLTHPRKCQGIGMVVVKALTSHILGRDRGMILWWKSLNVSEKGET